MSDIFDNYIKLCLLIRGPATQAFRALMTYYLQKCCLTFQEFIDINQHEIYHLHTERRCCQCTGQSFFGDRTLLQMSQIEKMFDTSSQTTSKRKDNHDYRKKDMCCCFANCQLCVDDVDITLLRILLNKFCNIFFWTWYLDIEHSGNFEQFLKNKRHELFHLWQPKITCCKCNEHKNTYKRPKKSEINQHEFERLYTIDGTITAVECTLNDTCTYSAKQGISLNDIKGTKLFKTITDCFCSPQKEINSIVETRNNFSHITDIPEEEFKKCWSTLRDNIKKIETMTESKLWTEESIDKLEQKLDLKNLLQEIKTDLGKSILNEKPSHEILDQMKRELKNLFQKSRENNPAQSFTSLSHRNYTESSICLHPKQLKLKLKKLYKENDCGTEEAEKRLKENCRNLNLTLRNETPRDGNCFFDAVSSQLRDLGLREMSAEEIRENVIVYLMENRNFQGVDGDVNIEHFIDDSTFEDWASNMRRNGVFADHVVVLGMARMLETNMLIVTSNPQASPENCMTHIVGKMNYDGMTINLGHVWENHYYSLISLDATRENGRLVENCKMQSLNCRHSPLSICTAALTKMELGTPPSDYEVTSVDICMTLKDRTITREMKIEGKGDVFAPDVREIEIPCSSCISPMSYDNGDGDSDCEYDLFRCGKCGKCFTTYESFSTHKKESIPCTQRKRKNIKKPTDTLDISSEQKQNMTPGKPNEKRIILKIRMQQTPGEMEPAWKHYVKQVQKTCTGNLDIDKDIIVEYIEDGSLVFWTKTNASAVKNKAKFAEIMDRFMVNLFQKCPIDTKDETKFSFSVDVVEGAEDEDNNDEDENDVFICGRCGITFISFSSFTSHKSNINLCFKKKRTYQQHKDESTSQDHDLSTRQRHQSAPEEPQSTTSTPSTSKSSTPVLPHLPQRQRHASVEQSTFNRPSSVGLETVKRPTDTSNFIVDKNLDNFLNSLWEKGNETNQIQPQKKRKLSSSEVDSTADQDQANFPNKEGTKLMKENALLAKLLSTKANKEKIVNTGISGNANPSATPQSRLTKDVSQKLLSVKPSLPLLSKTLSDSKLDTGSSNSNTDSFSVGSKEMGQLKNLNQTSGQNKMTDMLNSYNSSSNNIGQDDNSQDTYDSLQRMLFDSQSDNVMEFSEVSESSDPLLNVILQQAEDLKQDLTTPKTPSSSRGPTPAVNNGPLHENAPPVLSDLDLLSQFEQVLKEKNASLDEIDQLLGISNQAMGQAMGLVKTGGPNDMMAIEEIQKELMRDEPIHSNAMPNPMIARALQAQSSMNRQSFMQSMSAMTQSAMSQVPGNGNMDMGFQQISPPNPQQGFQQQQQNFGLPGPRLPGPPGPLASALSNGMQQRPGFPNSMAMQVRQSLLQQQKLKAQREMEKRRQAAEQARRRALMQAQLSNNFGSRFQPKKIDVEICLPCAPTPVVQEVGQASGKEDTGDTPTEFVIEVSGMKPTTTEDTLRYYFESRRGANADVVKMEFIEEKEMYMVWFEDESALEAVMSKNLRVDGQTLKAKRYVPPSPQKTVPKHDDKVFITNICPTTTKDGLENFLEVKSNCIPKECIFGEAEGTALVTFDQPPDIEKLQTACMMRPLDGSHLSIHTVPITDCVVVSGFKDTTSSVTMEYYFDNKRRSGVEGVREVKLVEDEGKCLVYFTDPDSALKVCNKKHTVEGQLLKVQVYYECLGQTALDDDGPKFKSLKPIVIQNVNPQKIEFLLNSDTNKTAFEKQLSRHYADVEWPDIKEIKDTLKVNCTLTEEVKDCRKLTQTWAKTVTTETEKFFSMFTVCEIQILPGAWDDVLKQISIFNPESVAVKVVKEDCKIVIVGHKVPVDEVAEIIGIIMKDVATEHDRKKLQVTEEVSLKHFQLLVLLHLYFLNKMEKEFEGLHIQVYRKKHIVIFTGRSSHVHAAKVKMFEQIQELTGLIVGKFSVGYIEFLKIPEVKTYISQQIQQKGVLGVWNVEEGNIITMYSLSDEGAVTACDVLKKSIIETPIPLDDKQISALLETDIWNKEIKAVEIEYQKALVKIVVADSKTIVIYQTSAEDKEILKEKVTDIFYRHVTSKEKIQLSSSEIRLLQKQYQIELSTLKEQSAKDQVTLYLDNISVYIQGNSKRVKDTKQKMDDILRSIYRKKYTIKKAGIVKHMRSEQGQAKISQVEKKNNVIIHLQTGNDNDDEEQDNSSKSEPISPKKTYKETAMCIIPSGQTIITVVGDITELDVDVIVNSANKELQHVGGLAKVIVDKGGKSIQKECDNYLGSKNRARKMYEGEIFCSSPGQLNCKMIVHAVGPVWQNGRQQEDEYLSECIQASLEKTEDEKYKSIAIPALCTGIFGYPANKATKVLVEAIRDYMRENGASSPICQIYLCDVKEDIVDHFVSALEKYFDKTNIKKQRGKSGHVSSSPVRSKHVSDYYGSCLTPKRPYHLDSHITVTLVKGQIASQKVDVIVNTTSRSLQLNQGAVSHSLLKMGGPGIQAECSQKYPSGIQPGEVAVTSGGKLECKMIFHGALPGYNGSTAMKIMETFMKNCLEIANDNGFVSVAFPALGTRNLGYPKNQVSKNMFSCVDRFSSSHPASSVCDVRFVVYDKDYPTIKAFEEEQRKRQSEEYVSTQTKNLGLDDTTHIEEEKTASTKQWTVSKMPSSVLNLVVYAKKENDADSALRSLEESLINDYKEKNIEDALIKELTKEQEDLILKLEETCEVEIEFNKKIGCINVRGLIENLSNAMDEVHKIIQDLDRQKQKQQQHAKIVPDMVQWYFISIEDTGQKLEAYPAEVNLILERALKNHEPQAFFLDNSGNKYVVDFNTYEEFPEDDPSDTVAVLRKSKLTDAAYDMPSSWASMDQNENIKIVTLQPADKEYQDIVHDFQTNMAGNYNAIIKIEKIQNKTLQQQYEAKKKSMDSTNATGTINERRLWHGTAMEAVDSINTYGFNRAFCGKNAVAYGNGVYFTVNPTYSTQAQYARPDPNGNKRMYMCKVLVGEFTGAHGGMKVPPPKPGAAGGRILYDSVVDNPKSPGIFVIFNDTQAYPEYLIVFR